MSPIAHGLRLSRRALGPVGAKLAAAALVVAAALAAPAHAASPHAGAYQVAIHNFAFAPTPLTVPAGARIVWKNLDDETHLVVSTNGAFKPSQALETNDKFAAVLAKPGTYAYYCGIHPHMVGKIIVH